MDVASATYDFDDGKVPEDRCTKYGETVVHIIGYENF